uniref:3-hydroxyacyl-CoA dehydrogenase n=1 Tax=Globodera rostochiensis TaxID=31243 RepID=A0A914H4X2_GLORO
MFIDLVIIDQFDEPEQTIYPTITPPTAPTTMIESYDPVEKIVVIGTGLMGSGIAQIAVESGIKVCLVGRSQEKCDQARQKINSGVQKSIKKRLGTESAEEQQQLLEATMACLKLVTSLDDACLFSADIVIEAVVENLKVKQKLFTELEAKVGEKCLLVTNTSSFLLEDVSCKLGAAKREQFGGLHFFNPVPAMKLVEVVRGSGTTDAAYNALIDFCQKLGKTPVKCMDTPGFIVNRLLIPYLADSMRLAESGNATRRDIDTAMRLGTGYPMGPFELMDYIGLDTMKFIMDGWHQRCPDDHRYSPCESLDNLVTIGKVGRKSGEGFYRYAK